MNFGQSVSACFSKYAEFGGRASKSEYWWWVLFLFLGSAAAGIIDNKVCDLFCIAVFLPTLAVATRRLHDTNRSGWWQLIEIIPVIGFIVMIIWCVQDPVEPNRFSSAAAAEA
ncbi:DUF805 domain-containing protein [Undibacterium sp. TJN25]|uniref:DUF805 domain-containing protein n=1 Tax=Undibacterium sp. TJN25 TaxID=3413056 RepID=UPI003BF17998